MQQNHSNFAHFGIQQGYAFQGDFAELSAELALPNLGADWAIQLWACDAPAATGELNGVMVAEASVDAGVIDPEGRGFVRTQVPATLPVGGRDYAMVMALARRDGSGLAHIHAVSNFQNRQWVEGPFMRGAAGYAVNGESVWLSVDGVYNPRQGNVSGTFALELWAFSNPYDGRPQADAQHLAGLELSCLAGQTSHLNVAGSTPFRTPQPGRWHMALLLREWTAVGYVTRDYRAFDVMYEHALPEAAPVAAAPVAAAPTVAVKPVVAAPAVVAPVAKPAAAVPAVAAPVQAAKPALVAAPAAVAAKPVAVVPVVAAPVATAPVAKEQSSDKRVCINTAAVDELAAVPGLTKKIAQEIVRGRPFKSVDDLGAVRGIGDKTLRKLRSVLKA